MTHPNITHGGFPADDIELTNGRWMRSDKWGVLEWVQTGPPPFPTVEPRAISELLACPTCEAAVTDSCRTATGTVCRPHASRLIPRVCACGGSLKDKGIKAYRCTNCTDKAKREAKANWVRNKRARLTDAA